MALNVYQLSDRVADVSHRLGAVEDQLAILSEKVGVPYDKPSSGVPAEVVELARAGKRLEAMRRNRELTSTSMDEASEVLAKL